MNDRIIEIENYWARVVRDTAEFQQIAIAENPEFNTVLKCLYNILKDGFINDLTENGAMRWEKILGLPVAPDATLEERKVQILTYLSIRRPYTWRVLKQMLTGLLGEDNFELSIDNDAQTLTIALASTVEHMREKIDELCARVIPQNLVIEFDNGLPIDYTPVEYLETVAHGSAYLQLGGEYFDILEIDITPTKLGNRDYFAQAVQAGKYRQSIESYSGYYAVCYGRDYSREHRSSVAVVAGERVKILMDSVNKTLTINGTLRSTENLFEVGTSTAQALRIPPHACLRLHGLTVTTNDVTANFIPALDPTGAPCVFDLVTRKPFYNSGTGDFLYPTDAAPAVSADLDEKFYAKRTEHGIHRLYHVPEGCTMSKDEYAAKNGFKEILEPPMPQEGYWVPEWKETETQLICEWVETEPPTEEGIEND